MAKKKMVYNICSLFLVLEVIAISTQHLLSRCLQLYNPPCGKTRVLWMQRVHSTSLLYW